MHAVLSFVRHAEAERKPASPGDRWCNFAEIDDSHQRWLIVPECPEG